MGAGGGIAGGGGGGGGDLLDLLGDLSMPSAAPQQQQQQQHQSGGASSASTVAAGGGGDLLDMLGDGGMNGGGGGGGGAGGGGGGPPAGVVMKVLLDGTKGKGMQIEGAARQSGGGSMVYHLAFKNVGSAPISGLAIQFNKNPMGITNHAPLSAPSIAPGASHYLALPLSSSQDKIQQGPLVLQVLIDPSTLDPILNMDCALFAGPLDDLDFLRPQNPACPRFSSQCHLSLPGCNQEQHGRPLFPGLTAAARLPGAVWQN